MEKRTDKATRRTVNGRDRVTRWVAVFTFLLSAVSITATHGTSSTSTALKSGLDLTQYRALRRMYAKSDRFDHEGWMEAWTEYDGESFRYTIVSERGSEYLRRKVLRAVLQREQDLIANGGAHRAALTEDNYTFGDDQESEDGHRYVPITPKRKEVTLVDGRMVLGPDGSVVRVEGRLAKNPSFWTSLVNVIRRFATVDGVRVPVSTESIAKVKFAGQSRLDMFYEYESINGRAVSIAARQTLASASRGPSAPD